MHLFSKTAFLIEFPLWLCVVLCVCVCISAFTHMWVLTNAFWLYQAEALPGLMTLGFHLSVQVSLATGKPFLLTW
jgi:hypothetical protein